ncbi:hypothetical protein HanRHA438_Chr07g0318221 [Helianthus annuus]|nr:hypothetical protein HanIR_Chr07g0333801 [Helianthus annuus]KAJ0909135.1 hypothetical protein HanRHA438_Chr07g0318221 [Helianthus annuus]
MRRVPPPSVARREDDISIESSISAAGHVFLSLFFIIVGYMSDYQGFNPCPTTCNHPINAW